MMNFVEFQFTIFMYFEPSFSNKIKSKIKEFSIEYDYLYRFIYQHRVKPKMDSNIKMSLFFIPPLSIIQNSFTRCNI